MVHFRSRHRPAFCQVFSTLRFECASFWLFCWNFFQKHLESPKQFLLLANHVMKTPIWFCFPLNLHKKYPATRRFYPVMHIFEVEYTVHATWWLEWNKFDSPCDSFLQSLIFCGSYYLEFIARWHFKKNRSTKQQQVTRGRLSNFLPQTLPVTVILR